MASLRQIEANRRNSQKSTGPKTEEGKAISSQNAIKHCLHAKDFLLFFEDFDGYEAFRYKLMEDQAPQTAEEIMYIDQICQSYFLSRRAVTCMSDAFDAASRNGKPVSHTYPLFMKMKNQNDRLVHKAFEALRQIKLSRQAAADPNKPNNLPEIGFVPPIYEPTPGYLRQVPRDPITDSFEPRETDNV